MNNQLRQYIDQGYAIITASQRQAHALKMAYANAMLEDGKTVWRTPEIKTWPVWMLNTWDDQQGDSSKVLLSPSQLRLIWESIIENSSYTKDILQVDTSSILPSRPMTPAWTGKLKSSRSRPFLIMIPGHLKPGSGHTVAG